MRSLAASILAAFLLSGCAATPAERARSCPQGNQAILLTDWPSTSPDAAVAVVTSSSGLQTVVWGRRQELAQDRVTIRWSWSIGRDGSPDPYDAFSDFRLEGGPVLRRGRAACAVDRRA
jgi:hypothetical protein